jgi:imidazolonepropionase-like amidohydrolase
MKRLAYSTSILEIGGGRSLPFFQGSHISEIKLLVDVLDMTPLEAITAATKHGAEVCSIGDKVGTVEKGKLADLLVVKRDPASNIDVLLEKKNIKYVIKEGVFVVGA